MGEPPPAQPGGPHPRGAVGVYRRRARPRPRLDGVQRRLGAGAARGRAGGVPAARAQVRRKRVMADVVLEARGLYKKFKKGEIHSSLRDLIPALLKHAVTGGLGREEFWALRDVSFQVERGEAFGV